MLGNSQIVRAGNNLHSPIVPIDWVEKASSNLYTEVENRPRQKPLIFPARTKITCILMPQTLVQLVGKRSHANDADYHPQFIAQMGLRPIEHAWMGVQIVNSG